MRKPAPSLSTRTEEFAPRELPLRAPQQQPRSHVALEPRAADKIKDALLRWLEEEL